MERELRWGEDAALARWLWLLPAAANVAPSSASAPPLGPLAAFKLRATDRQTLIVFIFAWLSLSKFEVRRAARLS